MHTMKCFAVLLLCLAASLRAQTPLSLAEVAAEPKIWPAEVMVTVDHKLPVVIDGKTAKTLKVGPGKIYRVKEITGSGVSVHGLGSLMVFKADETDVLARAGQAKQQALAAAVATPEPIAAAIPASTPSLSAPVPAAGTLAAKLQGLLVRLNGGRLEPFDTGKLANKKYLAVYFSASWCGPCRRFTPTLVDWYAKRQSYRDQFDVIFVSADQSERDMISYMAGDNMEWPAVSFNKTRISPLAKYGGRGIPCLVILNENGSVVAHSYEGDNYFGPMKPLKELDRLITGS